MGFNPFKTKKKHVVDSQAVRLVPDDQIPNVIQSALVRHLVDGQELSEALLDVALYGPHRNFDKYYKYAESGKYTYGLPQIALQSNVDGHVKAKEAIEVEEGRSVTIDYMHFLPPNYYHAGWKHLVDVLGYDHTTNNITVASANVGRPVYLDYMLAVVDTRDGLIDQRTLDTFGLNSKWGPTPERFASSSRSENPMRSGPTETDSVEIHYITTPINGQPPVKGFWVVDISHYSDFHGYYQAKYHYQVGSVVTTKYWTYGPHESSAHPALNNVFDAPGNLSTETFYPTVLFRRDGQNMARTELAGTPGYETSVKICDLIGVNFDDVANALQDNEDGNLIRQAALYMGIPLTSQDPDDIDYLMDYFEDLGTSIPNQNPTTVQGYLAYKGGTDTNYTVQLRSSGFDTSFAFNSLSIGLRAGTIVGGFSNTNVIVDSNEKGEILGLEFGILLDFVEVHLKRQVAPGIYQHIIVKSPVTLYHNIYENKTAEADAFDDNLLVPLDRRLVKLKPQLQQHKILFRAMHLVMNTDQVVKTKWYETGLFKVLLVIVAVAITIYTVGTTATGVVAATGAAVGTTAFATAFLVAMLEQIAIGAIVGYVLTEVASFVGAELALLLAIAAAAYGFYSAYQAGGIVANSTAANLLTVSSGLTSGVQNNLEEDFAELAEEYEAFNAESNRKLSELSEAQALLDTGLDLSTSYSYGKKPAFIPGETPDDYFNRLGHPGNSGVASLKIIQNYVAFSLRLPTIDQIPIGPRPDSGVAI